MGPCQEERRDRCGFSNVAYTYGARIALRSEWTLSSSVIAGPLPPSLPPRKLVVGVVKTIPGTTRIFSWRIGQKDKVPAPYTLGQFSQLRFHSALLLRTRLQYCLSVITKGETSVAYKARLALLRACRPWTRPRRAAHHRKQRATRPVCNSLTRHKKSAERRQSSQRSVTYLFCNRQDFCNGVVEDTRVRGSTENGITTVTRAETQLFNARESGTRQRR
jgi:hypothetical protein